MIWLVYTILIRIYKRYRTTNMKIILLLYNQQIHLINCIENNITATSSFWFSGHILLQSCKITIFTLIPSLLHCCLYYIIYIFVYFLYTHHIVEIFLFVCISIVCNQTPFSKTYCFVNIRIDSPYIVFTAHGRTISFLHNIK